MGNWSFYGIILGIGVFFTGIAFLLNQIQVTNPITGYQTSILAWLLSLILPF